ncbi:integral membrane protein dgcr2/idd [Plakobranchus ocellatus]|uniref:Integral membrane protein dgcr2/idd n=1 Tax=Plakobranchus ocellatus TaxID=259542 RepID=A0AAV4DB10_9GAST|nr:integral membrane protein dgcr2/idd [Plakobranchus ocellatus]
MGAATPVLGVEKGCDSPGLGGVTVGGKATPLDVMTAMICRMTCEKKILNLLILCLWISSSLAQGSENGTEVVVGDSDVSPDGQGSHGCLDWQGRSVQVGEEYIPSATDVCTKCTCDKFFPVMCHSVACSPPLHCSKVHVLVGACCEYVCLDDGSVPGNGSRPGDGGGTGDGESVTNLSLRLIASTVTSFLVLALLLFMVHRLRQRRLLLAMRRFEASSQQVHSEDTDSEPYIPEIFMSVECPPYTDPPPPYSPPKPPQILPGEEPPPYDDLSQNGDANGNSAQEDGNQVASESSRSAGYAHAPGDSHLASVSERRAMEGPRFTHLETPLNAHCRESLGPISSSGSENVPIENQRTQRRSAPDYNTDMRERPQVAHNSRTSASCCVSYTLPAYACTDVVGCLGVVLSPGEGQVNYTAPAMEPTQYQGINRWRHSCIHEETQLGRTPVRRNTTQEHSEAQYQHRREAAARRENNYQAQTMPTTTAFQRFSNLFKRNSWRIKNQHRHQNLSRGRGVSELQPNISMAHYTTIPGGDPRVHQSNNLYAGLDLSACNFYPTTASPSTSSSISSNGGDNVGAHQLQQCSDASPFSFSAHSYQAPDSHGIYDDASYNQRVISRRASAACGSRHHPMLNDSGLTSYHRDQFQEDLQQHLSSLCAQPADLRTSPSDNAENLPMRPRKHFYNTRQGDTSQEKSQVQPFPSLNQDLISHHQERVLPTSQSDWHSCLNSTHSLQASAQPAILSNVRAVPDPQRSLASFICSNLSVATTAHSQREQSTQQLSGLADINCPNQGNVSVSEVKSSQSSSDADTSQFQSSERHSVDETSLFHSPNSAFTNSQLRTHLHCLKQTSKNSSAEFVKNNGSQEPDAIRRSYSDTSEGSLISVCSETGEQKLKAARNSETNGHGEDEAKALPADCPYPQHPSLQSVCKSLFILKGNYEGFSEKNADVCGSSGDKQKYTIRNESELGACGGKSVCSDQKVREVCRCEDIEPSENVSAENSHLNMLYKSFPKNEEIFNEEGGPSYGTREPNYNLNTSQPSLKRLASKDLLPVVEEDRMVKSINIPPCSLSGYAVDETTQKTTNPSLPDLKEGIPLKNTAVKIADNLKDNCRQFKQQCNKASAKNSLGPSSFCHGNVQQRNSVCNTQGKTEGIQKINRKEYEKDLKVGKGTVKHRLQHEPSNHPHPLPQSLTIPDKQLITQPVVAAGQFYGNADVYRGNVHFASGNSHHLLTHKPGDVINIAITDSHIDRGLSIINDLNQQPQKPRQVFGRDAYVNAAAATSFYQGGDAQRRKRGRAGQHNHQYHRRQVSAGVSDRSSGLKISPAHRKPRPKSMAASFEAGVQQKRHSSPVIAPIQTGGDVCPIKGGARSGFGRDMNLDDENGAADFHMLSTASSQAQKNMCGYATIVGTSVPPSVPKQPLRSDSYGQSIDNGITRGIQGGHWSVNNNSNITKSGPSKDLSFVGRSSGKEKGYGNQRGKKRQSLPTFVTSGADFASGLFLAGENQNLARNEMHEQLGTPRIKNIGRTCSEDDVREATSYV